MKSPVYAAVFSCSGLIFFFCFIYFARSTSHLDPQKAYIEHDPDVALALLRENTKSNPESITSWLLLGKCHEKVAAPLQSNLREAANAYKEALKVDERNEEACINLARLELILGDHDAAFHFARRAIQINPACEPAWCTLSQTQIRNAARPELIDFIDRWSGSTSWKTQLAIQDARIATGQSLKQIACDFSNPTGSKSADKFLSARMHWLAGDTKESIQQLQLALASNPSDIELLRSIVRLCSSMQVDDFGIKFLESDKQCLIDPHLCLWYVRRKWSSGDLQAIIDAVNTGETRPFPTQPESNFMLWLAYCKLGDSDQVESLAKQLQRQSLRTESTKRWYQLIKSLEDQSSNARELSSIIASALEVSPSSPVVRLIHASHFYRFGEYHLAARLSGDAILLAPNWYQLWQLHVTSLALSEQQEEALRISELMIRKFPKSFDAHLVRQLLFGMTSLTTSSGGCKQIGDWAKKVRLPNSDPRQQSLRMIRKLSRASSKAAELNEEFQRVLIENYYLVASRNVNSSEQAKVANSPQPFSERLNVRDDNVRNTGSSPDANALLRKTYLSPSGDSIEKLEAASSESAFAWRILKARHLLESKTQKSAAAAISILRPVISKLSSHPDANMLMGLAFLQLDDINSATEHWYIASEADWKLAEQCLRLSLSALEDGIWDDAKSLVLFWNNVAAAIDQPGTPASNPNERAISYLLILSAYAENRGDAAVAEHAYRRLLDYDNAQKIPLNNLAFLLFKQGGSLDEAILLSNKSLKFAPENPDFQDTNAQISQALMQENTSKE